MRTALSVVIDIRPDRGWQLVVGGLAGAAAASTAAWAAAWQEAAAPVIGAAALAAAAGAAVLARPALASDTGRLGWDGAVWRFCAAGSSAEDSGGVRVLIDLGPWMLLRFEPVLRRRPRAWIALSRAASAGQWPAWRAAVYSRRPAPGPDAAARMQVPDRDR